MDEHNLRNLLNAFSELQRLIDQVLYEFAVDIVEAFKEELEMLGPDPAGNWKIVFKEEIEEAKAK